LCLDPIEIIKEIQLFYHDLNTTIQSRKKELKKPASSPFFQERKPLVSTDYVPCEEKEREKKNSRHEMICER
jgi:hypothetical protein